MAYDLKTELDRLHSELINEPQESPTHFLCPTCGFVPTCVHLQPMFDEMVNIHATQHIWQVDATIFRGRKVCDFGPKFQRG